METIGRYRVSHRIGSGAFATVWLAEDPELHVRVAIKVLADNWSHDDAVRERFLAEARILRRVNDARVIRVHDIGELPDGRPYFVMDHADGGTLADLVREPPGPLLALELGAEAARALQVLHEDGVLHRDVAPGNLLLQPQPDGAPRVVVADLGLAKSLAEASGFTVTVGTPAYMAPEQAHGRGGLDARADVYSVAAVTYALLTGRPPYAAEAGVHAVAGRSPSAVPRPVAGVVPVPPELDRVLRAALALDPTQRPASAHLLADELDGIRIRMGSGEGAPAGPRRWQGAAALVAAALAVFVAAAGATFALLG